MTGSALRWAMATALLASVAIGDEATKTGQDLWSAAVTREGRVAAMVELADEPTTLVYARARKRAVAALSARRDAEEHASRLARESLARIESAQHILLPALEEESIGARVIFRLQRAFNGIAIEVEEKQLAAIRALPGVVAVHPLLPLVPTNSTSVPWIGAPRVWDPSGAGATGAGVKVGIIDSGIDYIHKDFGGNASYTGQAWDDNVVPWTAKVVGGWDFAGDSYDGDNDPAPDADPMDCGSNGHGTHVAGTAAGYGVTTGGETYPGPYDGNTNYFSLRVGPGVAPGAALYALKIFGCSGSTRLTARALEWAVDPNSDGDLSDRLDVVNMSLGSRFGSPDYSTARAADNVAEAGVIVVASAGNSGDTYAITGSPGVSSRTISVANIRDGQYRASELTVTSPSDIAGDIRASAALFGPTTALAGVSASLALASPVDGCSAFSNSAQMNGRLAVLDRPNCDYVVKVKNAQNAGAVGVVVVSHLPGRVGMTGFDPTITIPALMISTADGDKIKAKLSNPGVTASLKVLSNGDTMSDSSSRGPSRDGEWIKPDIAAPGVEIDSARVRLGTSVATMSGTSMAAPHVAGAMAVLRQLHPDWPVAALKALAMNTATNVYGQEGFGPPIQSPSRVGAGRIDLAAAAASPVVAYDADHPERVSVAFSPLEVVDSTVVARSIQVDNRGASSITFSLAYTAVSDIPGVEVSFPGGSSVTVPAGGSASFSVEVAATASSMKHSTVSGLGETQDGEVRHWASEEAGYVTLTPAVGQDLRVPLRVVARPASALAATETVLSLGDGTGTTTLHLAGSGLATGTDLPTDIVSLFTPLELQHTGTPYYGSWGRSAALEYVGVGSDYTTRVVAGGGVANTTVLFGFATQADWATPNEVAFEVTIDTNADGAGDYSLSSESYATYIDEDATPSDVFGAILCPLAGGGCSWVSYVNGSAANERDTAVFHSNVMVLPVPATQLGLTDGSAGFAYTVATAHEDADDVSATPWLTYNVARPGLGFPLATVPPVVASGGMELVVQSDREAFDALASQGALLLHHHNASGNRAQVLLASAACSLTCSASVWDNAIVGALAELDGTAEATGCQGDLAYGWDLGDGATAQGQQVTHAYASPGSYAWQMTVTVDGVSCIDNGTITVDPPSPVRSPRRRLAPMPPASTRPAARPE